MIGILNLSITQK